MAKRRVLNEDGSFSDFKGPKPTYKVIPQEQKIAERKAMEELAHGHGFNPNNPIAGGLSVADKKFIEGASKEAIEALYSVRGVELGELPEDTKSEKIVGLTEEDKELIEVGISIPEMRKLAKDRGVNIPGDKKKAIDIKAFLLDEEDEEEL
tara:strand:- start:1330 stop:1782 length:453 start_codon:yes stop_codon:yes gene_type:complete